MTRLERPSASAETLNPILSCLVLGVDVESWTEAWGGKDAVLEAGYPQRVFLKARIKDPSCQVPRASKQACGDNLSSHSSGCAWSRRLHWDVFGYQFAKRIM